MRKRGDTGNSVRGRQDVAGIVILERRPADLFVLLQGFFRAETAVYRPCLFKLSLSPGLMTSGGLTDHVVWILISCVIDSVHAGVYLLVCLSDRK